MIAFFARRWGLAVLLVVFLLVAFAVNWRAPQRRVHLRRSAILTFACVALELASVVFAALHAARWTARLDFSAELFEQYAAIEIGAIVLFDLILPPFRVELAALASDLIIGAGYIIATILFLRTRGFDISSILTTSAIASAILALSLQQTLGNVIGGVALQLDGSIHVGDFVQLENGRKGRVRQIRWRHTVIETGDWGTLVVPNSSLLQGQILVLGKREGEPRQHRYWVSFNVDFRYAPTRVIEVVTEALRGAPIDNVASEPAPSCICTDLASPNMASVASYAARVFVIDIMKDDPTMSAVRERIHAALRRANIPLARPVVAAFYEPGGAREEAAALARHIEARRATLREVALFQTLTDEEIAELAPRLKFAPFARGERITKKGAVAHWLYILAQGSVEISVPESDHHHPIARVEAPGFFGEMGMMTGEPRSADVYAITDVDCLRLDKSGFEDIIKKRPEIANAMSQEMAKRRVQLSALSNLDEEARSVHHDRIAGEILESIKKFFGL